MLKVFLPQIPSHHSLRSPFLCLAQMEKVLLISTIPHVVLVKGGRRLEGGGIREISPLGPHRKPGWGERG